MKRQTGFTLIELSIVLVILAVIVGGVVTGQNLIKTAQLNSFVSDIERFESAFSRFQVQYQQLPGDMDNAYDLWGSDCATTEAYCNGDGDLLVEKTDGRRAWKHMSLAKLIDDYIAVVSDTAANTDCITGETMPITAFDSLVTNFNNTDDYHEAVSSSTVSIPGQVMIFGLQSSGEQFDACPTSSFPYFTAEQLYTIDRKIDDGFAYSGKVMNSENDTGCTDSANTGSGDVDDGNYDLANNGTNLCRLFVRLRID